MTVPFCPSCGVPSGVGEDHAADCQWLAALRAQAYPDVLNQTGNPWYIDRIQHLERQVADCQTRNTELVLKYREAREVIDHYAKHGADPRAARQFLQEHS